MKIIGALLLIPLVCSLVMWIFVVYGGEWATDGNFPIPDGSELLHIIVNDEPNLLYSYKIRFYSYDEQPENLREWYIENGVYMFPFSDGLDSEGNPTIKDTGVASSPSVFGDFLSRKEAMHYWSTTISTSFQGDFLPNCNYLSIYSKRSKFLERYPEMTSLPDTDNILVVRTCWANTR